MLVADADNRGGEQRHDLGHVSIVCHALLLAPALLDSPATTHISLASPSLLVLSEQTAASLRACCGYGVRKRRAEARETMCPRRPLCSATRSCPLPTCLLPHSPSHPSPCPCNSIAVSPEACCAYTGQRRRAGHERWRVCIITRALLPAPALLHSPAHCHV